jgi:lipoate-protein ligase B/very-short-patch-repair endonuclease
MIVRQLGRVDYETTWQRMREFTDSRAPESEDELWIVEHEPVFTQGIAGKPEHLLINTTNIPIVKTDRGGQITYHGPGQTVVYVMFNLKRAGFGVRELVIRIENAVIATLKEFAINAYGKRDAPGVYVDVSLSRSAGEGWGEGGATKSNHRILPARQIPEDLKRLAREMRANEADAEDRLWYFLRNRQLNGAKFRRQHPIGRYILDFYCDELKLAIELDGGQHADAVEYDEARTRWLNERGTDVLRVWNNEVFTNLEGVLDTIFSWIEAKRQFADSELPPSPRPSVSLRSSLPSVETATALRPAPSAGPALRERESEEAKVASLGLKIRNGCSYHGVALNVNMDLMPFSFINPCGYEGLRVTHLHDFGVHLPANDVGMRLASQLDLALNAPFSKTT